MKTLVAALLTIGGAFIGAGLIIVMREGQDPAPPPQQVQIAPAAVTAHPNVLPDLPRQPVARAARPTS
jgi:hypothetical protein